MYFESRAEAGIQLAQHLVATYRYEDCAVVALSDGAVLVGEEIATALHCVLTMLVTEEIDVPGESVSIGGLSQAGNFTHNSMLSAGEIDEYESEFHAYFDEQKREKFQALNRLLGDGGVLSRDLLRNRVVILVADGVGTGVEVDIAMDFLKPIHLRKVVIATPVASVPAVDKLHLLADELQILDVRDNYMGADHYYEDNTVPSHEATVAKINEIILHWQ